MKIAIISTLIDGPWGGSEELWYSTAREALRDGHEVLLSTLFTPQSHPKLQALQEQGVQILTRPFLRPSKLGLLRSKFSSLFQPLFQQQPDIILINQGGTYDPLMMNLGDFFVKLYDSNIPYVVLCHRNENSFVPNDELRAKATHFFQQAVQVLFVAEGNQRCAQRQLAQPLPNSRVVRNPVNMSDRDAVPWPSSKTLQLANVARLDTSFKGQDLLIEALSESIWQERDWHLNFYGNGCDRQYLEQLTRYFDLSDRITFHGHVSDVRSIWANNHALVLPSRREGTPLSLVEAMLCGRPAVVTDVGGNAEWILHSKNGFVAPAASVNAISNALDQFWQARQDWEILGHAARKTGLEKSTTTPGLEFLKLLVKLKSQTSTQKSTLLSAAITS